MLTAEMNERLTRVGPGTPMGELLRRYWHPFAATVELKDKPTKKVKLLGEDLALFRDGEGRYGLVAENCPHRRVSLVYGVPEDEGIRCPYHGWMFDTEGNCIEQPAESVNSTFKSRVKTVAYPVKEMGGLLFAYMGPGEAPELPNYDYYAQPNAIRQIGYTIVPANWLQIMENSMDPIHLEWLHMYYGNYVNTGKTKKDYGGFPQKRHAKISFDIFEHGLIKRRYYEGGSTADPEWQLGHPVLFPNILKQGRGFQIRVPMDDTTTLHWWYSCYSVDGIDVPEQDEVPMYLLPHVDEHGEIIVDSIPQQDMMAWATQGPIADRTVEHVGASDRGVLLYRKVLQEQIIAVEEGRDPLAVIRDPAKNPEVIWLPTEGGTGGDPADQKGTPEEVRVMMERQVRNSPLKDEIVDLYVRAAQRRQAESA